MATHDSIAAEDAKREASAAWDALFTAPTASARRARTTLAHDARPLARAWSLLTLGYHALFFGAHPLAARAPLAEAKALFEASADRHGFILAETGLARLQVIDGAPGASGERLRELEHEARRVLPVEDRFWFLDVRAVAHFFCGELDAAIRALYEALDALRDTAATQKRALVMSNLAAALVVVGDYEAAHELASGALAILAEPSLVRVAHANLAEALAGLGDYARAAKIADQMLEDAEDAAGGGQNQRLAIAAEIYAHEGRLDDAARAARDAAAVHEAFPVGFNEVHALWSAAVVADARGAADAALRFEAAAEAAARQRHAAIECKALARLAERLAGRGDFAAAYAVQRQLLAAQAARITHHASAHYRLRMDHELTRTRAERDRELEKRRETEEVNGELARLNAELQHRMIQIEALQAQLAVEALHDPLTQLYNRRYLDSVVPGLIGSAERRSAPLAVALVDLDHFKLVNDRHGHPAGDGVLRELGRVLPMAIRPADIVCRYGGEEFCVVLPDADAVGAEKVLASIAARLRDLRLEWNGTMLGGFTFSAGVAVLGEHGATFGELLAAADRALYRAKDAGRNRVLIAEGGATAC